MATKGRTARAAVATTEPSLDQERIDGAMTQMRADSAAEAAQRHLEIFDLGHKVGAVHMARLQADFSAAAEVSLFAEIQKSNAFKHLPMRDASGNLRTAENTEEFCRIVFGDGYKAMNERKITLEALGTSAYENAARLGLNRRQLRLVRALPDEQRGRVQTALESSNKAEVAALIEDLAAELGQAQEKLKEVQADKEATEQVLTDKNRTIDKLRAEQKRISKLPPDEQLAALSKEATSVMRDAAGAISGGVRQAVIAVRNHGDEDHTPFLAGLVGQLQAELNALREEFDLPDLSSAAGQQLAGEVQQWAGTR